MLHKDSEAIDDGGGGLIAATYSKTPFFSTKFPQSGQKKILYFKQQKSMILMKPLLLTD